MKTANDNLRAGLAEADVREKERQRIVYLQDSLDRAITLLGTSKHKVFVMEDKVAELEAVIAELKRDAIKSHEYGQMFLRRLDLVEKGYSRLTAAHAEKSRECREIMMERDELKRQLADTFGARLRKFWKETVLGRKKPFDPLEFDRWKVKS
jgi:hypothetical protein